MSTIAHEARRPVAPADFSPEAFFAGTCWHQRWEVFPGVFTPGHNPVAELCRNAQLPADLTGKRVLDIGAWNGCFSFECERRGAREVVALSLEDPDETGFHRLRKLLDSKVTYVRGSAYALAPDDLGQFDVVLFFGVLYHLRYPLLAIDRIRSICRGEVYIESHITDAKLRLRGLAGRLGLDRFTTWLLGSTPIWRQYKEFELHPQDQSNWFGPNSRAVIESFESAGFDCKLLHRNEDRGSFRASVKLQPPVRLLKCTYESMPANQRIVGLRETVATAEELSSRP
jgi:tRNA (mo5U34)-methyltransferase